MWAQLCKNVKQIELLKKNLNYLSSLMPKRQEHIIYQKINTFYGMYFPVLSFTQQNQEWQTEDLHRKLLKK